jgi:hypothetical protein
VVDGPFTVFDVAPFEDETEVRVAVIVPVMGGILMPRPERFIVMGQREPDGVGLPSPDIRTEKVSGV